MNMKMKSLILSLLTAVGLMVPLAAHAAGNLDSLQVADLSRIQAGDRKAGKAGESVRLWYIGTATEAVVTITTTAITAFAPAGTADSANFGLSLSSYQLNTAAYDTMGELCDAINRLAFYGCELLGARRSDASATMKDQVATTGTNNLKVTNTFNGVPPPGGGARILMDSGIGTDVAGTVYVDRVGIRPALDKRVYLKTVTCNGNVIGTLNISGKLQKFEGVQDGVTRDDSTIVWSQVTADDTDLTIPATLPQDSFLSFGKNEHVVISVGNGTSDQVAANYCQALWYEK